MKKQFAAYYELPEARVKEIWENALIIFDTNALLNLYRYKEETRNQFIKVIEFYGERLWLPYQVGMEYHKDREIVIKDTSNVYNKFEEDFTKIIDEAVDKVLNQYASMEHIDKTEIKKIVDRCKSSVKNRLKKHEQGLPDFTSKDVVLDTITRLYDNKIGVDLSLKELDKIYAEGEMRYAHKIPPGYADAKDKAQFGRRAKFGDLILWKQVLKESKERGKDVIFVTNDQKKDWYINDEGRHTPRKELIQEFYDFTGHNILIYKSSLFLKYAKQNKELVISQKTINEVSKVGFIETPYTSYLNLGNDGIISLNSLIYPNKPINFTSYINSDSDQYDFAKIFNDSYNNQRLNLTDLIETNYGNRLLNSEDLLKDYIRNNYSNILGSKINEE